MLKLKTLVGCLLMLMMVQRPAQSLSFKDLPLKNLAPYKLEVLTIKQCQEPNLKQIAHSHFDIKTDENGNSAILGNITLEEDVDKTIKERVIVWVYKNEKFEKVFNFVEKDLCACKVCVEKLLPNFVNIKKLEDGSCFVEKGSKTFEVDPDKYLHAWLGDKLMLGRFKTRLSYYTDETSTVCVDVDVNMKKI